MKKTTSSTTTTTSAISKDELLKLVKSAAADFAANKNAKEEVTAKVMEDSASALDEAVSKYNDAVLAEAYAEVAASDSPVVALCKRFAWSKMYTSLQKDKSTGALTVQLNSRRTRFSLINFLDYCEEQEVEIPNAPAIRNAIVKAARVLSEYVLGSIVTKKDENVKTCNIKTAKDALEELIEAIGMKSHARSVDVRFIAFAVTKARDLGELAKITDSSLAPYLMDVFHVQIEKKQYKFEEKKEGK